MNLPFQHCSSIGLYTLCSLVSVPVISVMSFRSHQQVAVVTPVALGCSVAMENLGALDGKLEDN